MNQQGTLNTSSLEIIERLKRELDVSRRKEQCFSFEILSDEVKIELRNCPFCHSTTLMWPSPKKGNTCYLQVHCDNCGANGPFGESKEQAFLLWNNATL